MDHDRLFKELLTTFFLDFLQLFCPELAEYLDPGSVEFLDKEVFTDVTHGERHEVDHLALSIRTFGLQWKKKNNSRRSCRSFAPKRGRA